MKKKILLLCTFFISLLIFINRISATTMYLDCYIDDRCKDTGTAWYNFWAEWECQPYLHTFALLTDNEGSANFEIISEGGGAYFMFENEDNCWLKGDFKDLGNLIDSNWELFKNYFPNRDFIIPKLNEMADCRNLIAHNSYIGDTERNLIKTYYNVILKQISETSNESE